MSRFIEFILQTKVMLALCTVSFKNPVSDTPLELFQKSPVMVAGLDLNLPVTATFGQPRPPISALSASFDKDAMCYAMFPALSVDPTYARCEN